MNLSSLNTTWHALARATLGQVEAYKSLIGIWLRGDGGVQLDACFTTAPG